MFVFLVVRLIKTQCRKQGLGSQLVIEKKHYFKWIYRQLIRKVQSYTAKENYKKKIIFFISIQKFCKKKSFKLLM